MLESIQKHWWLLLLRGILAIIFGFIALGAPGIVSFTFVLWFGVIAIFSGIFLVIEAIGNKENRGWRFLEAIVYILVGILFLLRPGFVLTFVAYYIAFWAIIVGIFEIYYAIKLRKEIKNEWFAILNGVLTLIFGILILTNIVAGLEAIVMVLGIFAIMSGILMIILSFKAKGLKSA